MSPGELDVSLSLHRLPLARPWTSRRGTTTQRWSVLVKVEGQGVRGLGEAPLPLRVQDPLILVRNVASSLPRLRSGEVFAARDALDRAGLHAWFRHGVMSALVDHGARLQGVSFATFLADAVRSPQNPVRVRVPPGGSIPVNGNLGPLDPEEAVQEGERLLQAGFSTIKVKSMGDADADARRLGALRRALGPDVFLRLDANGAWGVDEALDALKTLAPFSLQYVEEPLGEGSLGDRVRLAQKSPVPLAWDESVTDAQAASVLAPSAAALVVKPPRLGGVDRFLEVLAAGSGSATPLVVSTPLEGAIGRAVDLQLASLSPGSLAHGLGTGDALAGDLASPALLPEAGWVRMPPGPGIGAFELALDGTRVSWGDV